MQNWYLVYTKPRSEDLLSTKFVDSGLEVLNPKLSERKYIRRNIREVVSPLFPCYLFVKFRFPDDYRLVKYTRGVRKIISSASEPQVVPDYIIDAIVKRMKTGIVKLEPRKLKTGDEVTINAGHFKGFEAVFEKDLNGMERVCLLLNAINARIIIDRAMIV